MNNPVIHVITAQQSDMLQSVTYRLVLWRKLFVKKTEDLAHFENTQQKVTRITWDQPTNLQPEGIMHIL